MPRTEPQKSNSVSLDAIAGNINKRFSNVSRSVERVSETANAVQSDIANTHVPRLLRRLVRNIKRWVIGEQFTSCVGEVWGFTPIALGDNWLDFRQTYNVSGVVYPVNSKQWFHASETGKTYSVFIAPDTADYYISFLFDLSNDMQNANENMYLLGVCQTSNDNGQTWQSSVLISGNGSLLTNQISATPYGVQRCVVSGGYMIRLQANEWLRFGVHNQSNMANAIQNIQGGQARCIITKSKFTTL